MKAQHQHRGGNKTTRRLSSLECPECGSVDVSTGSQDHSFRYGGSDGILLTCEVPVHTCRSCQYEWTGSAAEDARQVAVCNHLGRLLPDEVREIRERHHLSQAEFGRITGFGEASQSRWETGAQIQSLSNDRLLRLIEMDDRNLERLMLIAGTPEPASSRKFRVIEITPALRRQQAEFRLRATG